MHLENLLKPCYVASGFFQVVLERRTELRGFRLLDHLRQRFDDLVFGAV